MLSRQQKELIKGMATDAIWSAKGHFKTSDWIGYNLFFLVAVPFFTSSITLILPLPEIGVKLVSLIGLVFSLFALLYGYMNNQKDGKKDSEKHMSLGSSYLRLYNELKQAYHLQAISPRTLQRIRDDLDKLNSESSNLKISWFGRWHSKLVINREVDMKWLGKRR